MSDQIEYRFDQRLESSFYCNREDNRSCVQLSVSGTIEDKASMTASFMEISRTLDVDISFQKIICTETAVWCVLIWTRPYSNRGY
jgi:hypothetical protein